MIMMASWDPACDDELRIRSASAIMNSDEFFHYHLRPRGMMRVEKYETYDFQPLVRVEYQGMQKRYETMILMFLPIASGHNLAGSGRVSSPSHIFITFKQRKHGLYSHRGRVPSADDDTLSHFLSVNI